MGVPPMFEVPLDFDRYPDRIKQERSDPSSQAGMNAKTPRRGEGREKLFAFLLFLLRVLASWRWSLE
jgi:hypothetical protein